MLLYQQHETPQSGFWQWFQAPSPSLSHTLMRNGQRTQGLHLSPEQFSHGKLTPYVHRLHLVQCHSLQSRHRPQSTQCQVQESWTASPAQKEYQ